MATRTAAPTATPSPTASSDTPNTGRASPASGGSLTSADGTVEIDVPPAAVGESVRLSFEPASYGRKGNVRILRSFHLQAESVADGRRVSRFRAPLTISVSYGSDEARKAGLNEATLSVYYLDEVRDTWQRLPSRVDRSRRRIVGSVDHFSVFAVGGETFENAGPAGNSFADNFADLNAWTTVSGSGSASNNKLVAAGAAGSADRFIIANSSAYSDFTYQVEVTDLGQAVGHQVGALFRYTDANNHYFAYLESASTVGLARKQGGATTILGTNTFTSSGSYWLKVVTSGSSITVSWANDTGGAPGSFTQAVQVTDGAFASGSLGLANINSTGSQRGGEFAAPSVQVTLPQDWGGIVQQTGRPGLIWDKVTAAHGGSGSLQLFGGSSSFVGYAAQTTSNGVTGGTRYDVSGWIKTSGVGAGGAQVVLVEQPSGTQTTVGTQTGTQGWTPYSTSPTLRSDTTSLDVRVVLNGSGTANFDDISPTRSFSMTISTGSAPFGTVLAPDGAASDRVDVGTGYVESGNGSYYVKSRNAASHAVSVTVTSGTAWSGSVTASESGGTSGQRISSGSLRWKLGDIGNVTEAQGATAFATVADTTVWDAASSCASGSTKQPGACTYNFDYTLRVRWTDAPGTFSSTVTYSASP